MRFFPDNTPLIAFIANLIPLLHFHFAKAFRTPGYEISHGLFLLLFVGYLSVVIFFFIDFASQDKIRYVDLIAATTVWATLLFVMISEIMMRGGALYLTRKRGEKWAKELDYIYLSLGALGLAMSTNRLDVVDHKFWVPEYIGPFVLATALVIRTIKARAEINDWNKLPKPLATGTPIRAAAERVEPPY